MPITGCDVVCVQGRRRRRGVEAGGASDGGRRRGSRGACGTRDDRSDAGDGARRPGGDRRADGGARTSTRQCTRSTAAATGTGR